MKPFSRHTTLGTASRRVEGTKYHRLEVLSKASALEIIISQNEEYSHEPTDVSTLVIDNALSKPQCPTWHKDTHQMWLRQGAVISCILVIWLAFNQIQADGLTNSLTLL